MKVKYLGDAKTVQSTKGTDIKLEKDGVYDCMEKEYHSALFVRLTICNERVKVKRGELQKV